MIKNETFTVSGSIKVMNSKEKQIDCIEHFEAYGQCRDSGRIAVLEKQVKELEAKLTSNRTAYIKGMRTMANALKKYDREFGGWTDYFEHTVDKVLKNLLEALHAEDEGYD